jgi:hypothetical protein
MTVLSASTASYAATASYALQANTASYATTAGTANAVNQLNQNVTIVGNLNVFGTASYTYTTASQLDVGTSYISVNVAEPGERFGGLKVYDSGSLSHLATASLSWDSLNNKWIYQNASGSTYSGGMLISGPRNTGSMGNEQGTTTNALMKGQGGDHITSSGIFEDASGNVGIGTNTPAYALDLYGTYHQYQAQGEIARYDISSANANQNRGVWNFYTNAAASADFFGRFGFKFEGGTADSFKQFQVHVADSTTPKFVVNGSGRVGIGTIAPSAPLEVVGNTLISGSITQRGGGMFLYDINGYGGGRIYGSYNYLNGEILISPSSSLSDNFVFSPNNGMSIGGFTIGGTTGSPPAYGLSVSGSIGIGTRVPTARLHISGSTSQALLVVSSSAGPALFVSGSGNVGIGTTTPAVKFTIQQSNQVYSQIDTINFDMAVGIAANSSLISGLDFKNFNNAGQVRLMARNDQNDYLAINSYGSAASGTLFGVNRTNLHALFAQATSDATKKLAIGTFNAGDLILGTNNTERARIFANGNVAIGTTTDAGYKLDVSGSGRFVSDLIVGNTTAVSNLQLGPSPSGNYGATFKMLGYNSSFKNWELSVGLRGQNFSITPSTVDGGTTFTTPALAISTTSNVLIGTTTDPGYRLNVSGSGNFTNGLTITGSFTNVLDSTSVKIQSNTSSSFSVGSFYASGIGWNSIAFSGSQTAFRSDTDGTYINGLNEGNLYIPAFGLSFPYKGNSQIIATGSDFVTIGTQYTNAAAIGGSPSLATNQNGVFSGSYGKNEYIIGLGKVLTTEEGSLYLTKRDNDGKTISLNLNSGNDGFSIFSTLSSESSSFLRLVSGSSNSLVNFRYDANYIQRPTFIGVDSSAGVQQQFTLDVSGSGRFTDSVQVTGSLDVQGDVKQNGVSLQALSIAYAIALG